MPNDPREPEDLLGDVERRRLDQPGRRPHIMNRQLDALGPERQAKLTQELA